jgi:D-arginine dehydrogenase
LGLYEDDARRHGVEFCYQEEVREVAVAKGRIEAVVTSRRTIPTRGLIVAAGAWAGKVAALAGSTAIEITPRRRHLFRGGLNGEPYPDWPFVWHEEKGVYFRPEGEGLIFSPCDVETHPAVAPEVDPAQRDILAQKLDDAFGALGDWRIGPGWACLRTFAPDDRCVVGHDPQIEGLFWVAALGGHGVTTSWAVGDLAADVLLGTREPGPFDPARFSA